MKRTQISLTNEDRRLLDAAAARTGRSIAALIRDAVAQVYGSERSVGDDLAAMRRAFGSWHDSGSDGAAWVDELRSGRRLDGGEEAVSGGKGASGNLEAQERGTSSNCGGGA